MPLYKWWSEALRQHCQGIIIVQAASVPRARKVALAQVEATIREEWPWLYDEAFAERSPDREGYDKKVSQFLKDLEAEPEDVPGCLMVRGDC